MRLSAPPAPAEAPLRRAVFIDKDGTLIEDVPYNVDPALLRFTPHAAEALRRLQAAGFRLIVVSNQPGVALGLFGLPALQRLAGALTARLADEGVQLDGFHACPHAPVAASAADVPAAAGPVPGGPAADLQTAADPVPRGCRCRKPAPGLLLEAAREHAIDLAGSWMVGDILDDVEAGWLAGCRTVHLDVGNETVWRRSPIRVPTHTAPHLLAAAEAILAATPTGRARRQAAVETALPGA